MSVRRLAPVWLWLLALALCAVWLARHLVVSADLTVFLPPSSTPTQRLLLAQLRDGATSRLMLIGLTDGEPAQLAATSRALAARLRASPRFSLVANGEAAGLARERELLLANRYLLSPAVTPERFSEKGLEAALQASLEALASPAGPLVRPMLPLDPTGELREIAALLTSAGGPALREGVWFSRDGSRALLLAETRAAGFDVEAQALAVQAVEGAFAAARAGAARLELAGPGVFAARMRSSIRVEAWELSLAAAALVIAILAAAYRSAAAVAACALPVATGLAVGITVVSLGFGSVHGLTLAFGATLIGEAVDYPSYLLAQAAPGEAPPAAASRIGPTLMLAALTTALGAAALALSSFEGLAQLGVLTAAGVLAAAATARWVLPALVPLAALSRKAPGLAPRAMPARAVALGRWPALAATAAALAFIVLGQERLWDDDLAHLSPIPQSAKALDRELREALGAPDVRYLMVARGADRERALQASEAMAAWLAAAVDSGRLAGFDAPSSYLPSRRTQLARREALPDPRTLALNLKTVLARSPFRADAFSPFLDSVAKARERPLLEPESLRGSALGLKLESLLVANEDGWAALAPLRGVSGPAALAAAAAGKDFELLDLKQEANDLVNRYREESLRLVGLGLALIAALLAASLRSMPRALRVAAPVLAAAAVDVALLALLGRQLSLFNLPALLLVIGIGLNYALFFERPQRDAPERARTRLSVAVCAATTLSVFGCLALSATPVLRTIGETVFFGCLLSLAFAAAFAGQRDPGAA